REIAHAEHLGAGDVDRHGRSGGDAYGTDDVVEGVGLPDHVDVAHRHIDRAAVAHAGGDINEHAVAKLHRVVEPDERHAGAVLAGGVGEGLLTLQAGGGVVAVGLRGDGFVGTGRGGCHKRINAAGGEGDDAGAPVALRGDAGDGDVHLFQ